ncbi:MAG: molybdopterin dinucleotide binding domain-containing protein [Bryobacteraceae bacterium]
MKFARRDLLRFAGGSAAALPLTPLPWKLLRDSAVVSQNWPGVPEPSHGEIRTRYTTCTLCPEGCGVRARCVGEQPVGLAGVPGHPSGRGALCPVGLTGHHLPFHPQRAREFLDHGKPTSRDEAVAAVSSALKNCERGQCVAILDSRPGRTASSVYQKFIDRMPEGLLCAPPGTRPYGQFGIDLENTRTILSFGVPVLDGWLSPGRVLPNRGRFQLIQVEPVHSHTAALADLWVPVRPGGETAFAESLLRALHGESPSDEHIAQVLRILANAKPAIAIGRGPMRRLNSALGSIGRSGGFMARRETAPAARDFSTVPDHSIRVLLIDEGYSNPLAWDFIRTKLADKATVVAMTPWLDGYGRLADYVVPSPVYLESLDEAPAPTAAIIASFSLSPALIQTPAQVVTAPDFVLQLAGDATTYLDALKARVAAIHSGGRGTLLTYANQATFRMADVSSAEDLWKALLDGSVWLDDRLPQTKATQAELSETPLPPSSDAALTVVAAVTPPLHGSPLMTKLYQESQLRLPADVVKLNPRTARDRNLEDGDAAVVETRFGSRSVKVLLDPAATPDLIEATLPHQSPGACAPAAIRRA